MVGFDNLAIRMYSVACLYLVWFPFFVQVGFGRGWRLVCFIFWVCNLGCIVKQIRKNNKVNLYSKNGGLFSNVLMIIIDRVALKWVYQLATRRIKSKNSCPFPF